MAGDHDQDRALVDRVRAGDLDAFDALVERWRDRVWRLCRRLTGSDSDAEDAVQETFLTLFRSLDDFRGDAAVSTWIYRIAASRALDRVRRRAARAEESLDTGLRFDEHGQLAEAPPAPALNERDPSARKELRDLLLRAIAALPETDRAVFLLRDAEGASTAETAAALDLTEDAVKSRLHRARLALRKNLLDYRSPGRRGSRGKPDRSKTKR